METIKTIVNFEGIHLEGKKAEEFTKHLSIIRHGQFVKDPEKTTRTISLCEQGFNTPISAEWWPDSFQKELEAALFILKALGIIEIPKEKKPAKRKR